MSQRGYVSVDLPPSLQSGMGGYLADLQRFIAAAYPLARMERREKPVGGHVTPWWLYVEFGARAPAKSRVQFGETTFARVNRTPHLWARAKGKFLQLGLDLLRDFSA